VYFMVAMTASVVLSAAAQLLLSPVSDATGKRRVFVGAFTLLACAGLAWMPQAGTLTAALAWLALANFGAASAAVFYNVMLADVADEGDREKVSGLGIGLGYFGTPLGLLLGAAFIKPNDYGPVFLPTAVVLLALTCPLMIFARERPPERVVAVKTALSETLASLRRTAADVWRDRRLRLFLLAYFLALDAQSTVTLTMAVYARDVVGLTETMRQFGPLKLDNVSLIILVSALVAIVAGVAWGWLAARFGNGRTILGVIVTWLLGLVLAAATPWMWLFWVAGCLMGAGYAGVWTVGRSYLLELCPPGERAQVFTLFGLAGRVSAMVGPLLWAAAIWLTTGLGAAKYRVGLLVLLALMTGALALLRRVPAAK
jgi:UMF1 family MFS transporter